MCRLPSCPASCSCLTTSEGVATITCSNSNLTEVANSFTSHAGS